MHRECPVERAMTHLLQSRGIRFTRPERHGRNLDFHLTDVGLAVEVKQFATSNRLEAQIRASRYDDVLVLVGRDSVRLFERLVDAMTDGDPLNEEK